MAITISDSNPIRFYNSGLESSYNDTIVVGVEPGKYNHFYLNADSITLQVQSDSSVTAEIYDLSDNSLLDTVALTLDASGYYSLNYGVASLISANPSLQSIYILLNTIWRSEVIDLLRPISNVLTNSEFTTDLSDWVVIDNPGPGLGAATTWSWRADFGGSVRIFDSETKAQDVITQEVTIPKDTTINVTITTALDSIPSGASSVTLQVWTRRASDGEWINRREIVDGHFLNTVMEESTFTVPGNSEVYDAFGIGVISYDEFYLYYIGSIQIDLVTAFEATGLPNKLITYSNDTPFDGIDYSILPTDLNARISAQFWKERYEQESEYIEKSNNSFIRTYNRVVTKRLLQTEYMPNYMHKKLIRILMHDNISIDGVQYIKQDEYEFENINRYGLSKASVWLTEKDTIIKNVL